MLRKGRNQDVEFRVNSLLDIELKIIPLFTKYPLQGAKKLDFEDFVKIYIIMKNKKHLTFEGVNAIKLIQSGMNSSSARTVKGEKRKSKKQNKIKVL